MFQGYQEQHGFVKQITPCRELQLQLKRSRRRIAIVIAMRIEKKNTRFEA